MQTARLGVFIDAKYKPILRLYAQKTHRSVPKLIECLIDTVLQDYQEKDLIEIMREGVEEIA